MLRNNKNLFYITHLFDCFCDKLMWNDVMGLNISSGSCNNVKLVLYVLKEWVARMQVQFHYFYYKGCLFHNSLKVNSVQVNFITVLTSDIWGLKLFSFYCFYLHIIVYSDKNILKTVHYRSHLLLLISIYAICMTCCQTLKWRQINVH